MLRTAGTLGRVVGIAASLLLAGSAIANEAPVDRKAALDTAVARVKADLAQRTKGSPDTIRTVSADAVQWRDTSMGCGSPNASYAQIEVDGFQIVLEYDDQRYDYRARQDGEFVLCEAGLAKQ